jgi:hypothetical protein
MNKVQAKKTHDRTWQNLTLSQYVHRRNGVPLGDAKSLPNMLHRSFGAASFAAFWQYWNPIWGYGLGKYVYTPWFFLLGMGAVLGRALEMDLAERPWRVRAIINLFYLVSGLVLTLIVKKEFLI